MTEQLGTATDAKQRDVGSRLETLDTLISRMSSVASRIRRISDRLYGASPECDSNEVESVPNGWVAQFSRLNDTGLGHVSVMEELLTRIEEAI